MKVQFFIFVFVCCAFKVSLAQDYWMQLNTPDSATIYQIEISPEGKTLLGTKKGIYVSQDNGLSWMKLGDLNAGVSQIEYFADGEISAGSSNLYNSTDQGQTWNLVHSSLLMKSLYCTNENYLLLGRWGGIMKSLDRGYTWDTVYPTGTSAIFGSFVELDAKYYSGGSDFIGGDNSGFFRSIDYGDTWELISLQQYGITKLALDLDNNFLAGVAISPLGQSNGLFKSTNAGISWTQLFDQQQVNQVAVDSLGGYYIGLDSWAGGPWGVYYSSDHGDSWQELNAGIPQANLIHDLDVNSLYAYCLVVNYKDERVLYRSRNPIVNISENKGGYQNYLHLFPNPVRNSKYLTICNTSEEEYNICIIDSKGKSIMDKIIIQNKSSITINDCNDWVSGLYSIIFYNDNHCFEKKVIKINN